MRNTFLELETKPMRSYNFCFVGINYCSAEYLLGVQKAADRVRALSYRYANADGSSLPLKVYSPEEGYILKDTQVYDLGNVCASSLNELESELSKVEFQTGCTPVFVGGDHSVTYGAVKRMAKDYDNIVVVQFDAHSDFIDEYEDYPHGSVMNEVCKIQQVSKIVHFGIRGNLNCGPAICKSKEMGNIVIPYVEIKERLSSLLEFLKGKKVYITFDTDFLNPSYAPATNCPEPGGPSYEDTLKYLKAVIESCEKIIGMDFVEYNPDCEGSVVTGTTIVNLIMEALSYMTKKNKHYFLTDRMEE